MHLSVLSEDDTLITVECFPSDSVAGLKSKVSAQIGIPQHQLLLTYNNKLLGDGETMSSVGVVDGDLLMLRRQNSLPQQSSTGVPRDFRANDFVSEALANPLLMSQIESTNPQLADAIRSNDLSKVESIVRTTWQSQRARQQEIDQLMLNPMDIESQKKIEELIRQKNVEENFMQALEYTPEVFGSVTMLYVNMEVNGVPVQAMVDSGAEITVMTQEFAEKCSLMRLIDKRFSGTVHGVGQGKIIGRVHQAPLKVGEDYVTSSLVVLEHNTDMPFIFGLDNLIRHQCTIDLKNMKLKFGSINSEVPFLVEHQIARYAKRRTLSIPGSSSETRATGTDIPEEKIQRLVSMGFDRQRCIEALRATGGNEDAAASILLGYN